mmetsp:Transcript_45185/g.143847  ORF Transcript_45185/g.143847 Transcript_45185/m.143847 type:complete len:277 (-) Transcript_45185:719-1549(-)
MDHVIVPVLGVAEVINCAAGVGALGDAVAAVRPRLWVAEAVGAAVIAAPLLPTVANGAKFGRVGRRWARRARHRERAPLPGAPVVGHSGGIDDVVPPAVLEHRERDGGEQLPRGYARPGLHNLIARSPSLPVNHSGPARAVVLHLHPCQAAAAKVRRRLLFHLGGLHDGAPVGSPYDVVAPAGAAALVHPQVIEAGSERQAVDDLVEDGVGVVPLVDVAELKLLERGGAKVDSHGHGAVVLLGVHQAVGSPRNVAEVIVAARRGWRGSHVKNDVRV